MSERQITGPELAALLFRIVGVVILVSGIAQGLIVLLTIAQAERSAWSLLGLLLSLVFTAAVALPLIFSSESLVTWAFPKSDKTLGLAVSRRDLLVCGIAIIGVWFLAANLPYLARLAGELLWNLEGTRRSQLGPELARRAASEALGSAFSCVAGWLLFRYAGRIVEWWEARAGGGS